MLRRRVEKSGDATRESRTEIDMREPVSVEDLRHADEQALGHVPGPPPSGHRTFSRRRPLPSIRKTLRRGIEPLHLESRGEA
jgi:hypothetical protein